MTNPKTSSAATDFYEIAHTAQETVTDFNRAVQRGDREHAMEIMSDEEKKKLFAIAPVTRSLQNQMNLIRKRVNYIKDQNDRDPDERRDEINKLMRDYHDVASRIYEVMEKAGIER
jgi:CMP-N-acetylneuraminic acid synthetase